MENTVFQAEVLAIREAVKDYIQIKQTDKKNVKIFTDSQAALLALAKSTVTSIGKTVYSLEICWIKAHTGHFFFVEGSAPVLCVRNGHTIPHRVGKTMKESDHVWRGGKGLHF